MSTDQDTWNFYFGRVDGALASTFVNLSLAERAPVPGYADCVYLSLSMQNPREDGLSSQQEFDVLNAFEDRLSEIISEQDGIFAGRVTHAGLRDFFAYFRSAQTAKSALTAIQTEFPGYRIEIGARTDLKWEVYTGYLYPSKFALAHIQNRDVLEALKRQGDALDQPREIRHYVYLPDLDSARAFAQAAKEAGFLAKNIGVPAKGDGVGVILTHKAAPANIDAITDMIIGALEDEVGIYDGWECPVAAKG